MYSRSENLDNRSAKTWATSEMFWAIPAGLAGVGTVALGALLITSSTFSGLIHSAGIRKLLGIVLLGPGSGALYLCAHKIMEVFERHEAPTKPPPYAPYVPTFKPQVTKPKVTEKPIVRFEEFTVSLTLSREGRQTFRITSAEEVDTLVKRIDEEIREQHMPLMFHLDDKYGCGISRIKQYLQTLQSSSCAPSTEFKDPLVSHHLLAIPKPIKIENAGDGKMRRLFANGVVEIFKAIGGREYRGTRILADGTQEKGVFDLRGTFFSGYRIGKEGQITYFRPQPLASYDDKYSKREFGIYEVEDELVVLENKQDEYISAELTVEDVLEKASHMPDHGQGKSILHILQHKTFEPHLDSFIERILGADVLGFTRLFCLSSRAIMDIFEITSKNEAFDPLKIVDAQYQQNILTHSARRGDADLLNQVLRLFPMQCKSVGSEMVEEFLRSRRPLKNAGCLLDTFQESLDPYHELWIKVAKGCEADENFALKFKDLSPEQQRVIYDEALSFNNPYIHEPSERTVTGEQYSINLMWINKDKVPADQEFLLEGFHDRFVTPVSKWAQANPDSSLNIWFDSEMATSGAIQRSQEALEKELEGAQHSTLHFRDVRACQVVQEHPKVFDASTFVYFRVDLLRAIAADHVLRNQECTYFVYGDIDMEPLSSHELFDKRTLDLLDDFGIVFASKGAFGFENGFQILNGKHQQCLDSHRKVIIDLSIEMALEIPHAIKEQQIYNTYPAMITHLLDADGRYGKFLPPGSSTPNMRQENYRFDRFGAASYVEIHFENTHVQLADIAPKKPVRLPPSHF